MSAIALILWLLFMGQQAAKPLTAHTYTRADGSPCQNSDIWNGKYCAKTTVIIPLELQRTDDTPCVKGDEVLWTYDGLGGVEAKCKVPPQKTVYSSGDGPLNYLNLTEINKEKCEKLKGQWGLLWPEMQDANVVATPKAYCYFPPDGVPTVASDFDHSPLTKSLPISNGDYPAGTCGYFDGKQWQPFNDQINCQISPLQPHYSFTIESRPAVTSSNFCCIYGSQPLIDCFKSTGNPDDKAMADHAWFPSSEPYMPNWY